VARGGNVQHAAVSSRPYLEEEAEAHPLVVAVSLPVVRLAAGVVHARVRDGDAHLLLERLLDGVRRVYPTVRVEHVLGYVLGVHAVDRVADVLPGGDDQAERGQQHHGQAVVEPEHGRVDVHVADFHQALQAPEHVKHGVPCRRDTPSVSTVAFPQRSQSSGLSAVAVGAVHVDDDQQTAAADRTRGRHHSGHRGAAVVVVVVGGVGGGGGDDGDSGAAIAVATAVVVVVVLRPAAQCRFFLSFLRQTPANETPARH